MFAEKKANLLGLQLADLIARPIGRHVLNPNQPNRAFDILSSKIFFAQQSNGASRIADSVDKIIVLP